MRRLKEKIITWEEGKMYLEPGNIYSMTGRELIDFGKRVTSNGFLIANTLVYKVNPFTGIPGKWDIQLLNQS